MRVKKRYKSIIPAGKIFRNDDVSKLRSLFQARDLTEAVNFLESLGCTDENLVFFILAWVGGAL